MAVVESPFLQNVSFAEIPRGGTFVAGRKRRRINNDPYGGEGFAWDDWEEVANAVDSEPESGDTRQDFQDGGFIPTNFAPAHVVELPEQQRSSATRRLDQVKQHLLDLSIRRPINRTAPPQAQGFSLDNIHMGIGNLYEWSSPQWNCPQSFSMLPASDSGFDREWQQFTRNVLFHSPPQPIPPPPFPRELRYQEPMPPSPDASTHNSENYVPSNTTKSQPQPQYQSLAEQRKAFRHPGWSNASASSEPWRESYSQSKPIPTTTTRRTRKVRFKAQPVAVFEPVDVHYSSWSSLMAQGRRKIAAMA